MMRRGMATVLVIALMLVLAVFGAAMMAMSRGANREVDVLGDHLRALAVGDAAFASVIGRLSARPWSQRWFAGAPDVRRAVSAAGGSYDSVVRDAPRGAAPADPLTAVSLGSPNQADLLVRATFGRSTVVLFWRLTGPADALDAFARVVPTYFTYLPEDTAARPQVLDPIAITIEEAIAAREANRPRFERQRRRLTGPVTTGQVGSVLEAEPAPPAVDVVAFPGEPPRSNEPYLREALPGTAKSPTGAPGGATLPPLPTVPPPTIVPLITPTPTATPTPTPTPTGPVGLSPQDALAGQNLYRAMSRYSCALELAATPSAAAPYTEAADRIRQTLADFGAAQNSGAPDSELRVLLDRYLAAVANAQAMNIQALGLFGGAQTGTACDNQNFDL